MKFKQEIMKADPTIKNIPSGFNRYGNIIVLRSSKLLSEKLGEIIIELYPWCKSVFQHLTTSGESRIPKLVHLGGINNTVVEHKENGVKYLIDLANITFSGGNRQLRERLVDEVKNGEVLLDMFAAVGNLSLQPLVYKNITGILIEKNSYTYSYLKKTIELNNLSNVESLNIDCRQFSQSNIADRIFMGYHEVNHSHIKIAVKAAKSDAIIHLHPLVKSSNWDEVIQYYISILKSLNVVPTIMNIGQIKSYSPGIDHIEIMIKLGI